MEKGKANGNGNRGTGCSEDDKGRALIRGCCHLGGERWDARSFQAAGKGQGSGLGRGFGVNDEIPEARPGLFVNLPELQSHSDGR